MKLNEYLIVSRDGAMRALKNRPPDTLGEVCLPLRLDIPDALFSPPPIPTVEITLDESVLPVLSIVSDSMDALQKAGVSVRLVNTFQEEKETHEQTP